MRMCCHAKKQWWKKQLAFIWCIVCVVNCAGWHNPDKTTAVHGSDEVQIWEKTLQNCTFCFVLHYVSYKHSTWIFINAKPFHSQKIHVNSVNQTNAFDTCFTNTNICNNLSTAFQCFDIIYFIEWQWYLFTV